MELYFCAKKPLVPKRNQILHFFAQIDLGFPTLSPKKVTFTTLLKGFNVNFNVF